VLGLALGIGASTGLRGIGPALAGNVGASWAFALSREGDQDVDVPMLAPDRSRCRFVDWRYVPLWDGLVVAIEEKQSSLTRCVVVMAWGRWGRGDAEAVGGSGEGEAFGVPQRGTACVNMKLKRLTGERPSTVLAWRRVAEGNCVAVRRGGEQPKANLSSQSSQTRRLNPIRLVGVASLRAKGEALALSLPEAITKHDHTIAKDSDGVWDEKAGKAEQLSVEILLGATESGEEVRALIVALKRVTTVEPRGAGR
jgi:hypothetical protein